MPAIHQATTNGFGPGAEHGGSLGSLLNKVSLGGTSIAGQWDNYRSKTGESIEPSTTSSQYERSNVTTSSSSAYAPSHTPSHKSSTFSLSSQATFPPPTITQQPSPPPTSNSRDFPPPLSPRSYTILKEVGDGSFGTVWLADWHSSLVLPPGTLPPGPSSRPEYKGKKLVAIKRMKKAFDGGWDECMKLKELRSLRQIPMHANIIPLYDAFLLPSTKELYFVFECMEGNLYQLTKSRKGRPLASGLTASIFHQILSGLDHIHSSGYFHRDMKPENLLITTTGLADYPASSLYALPGAQPEKDVVVVVKLADFGLARETESKPPYTEYVSTRWYRAPEVLLRSRDYSNPVDMWALGTILVELITLKPLFPGDSEVDQVFKICEVLGDPATDYGANERGFLRGGGIWPRGVKMAKDVGFAFPKIAPRQLAGLFDPNIVPAQLIDCVANLLRFDPDARLTTKQCFDHSYFREVAYRFAPYRAAASSTPAPSYLTSPVSALPSPLPTATRPLPPSHSTSASNAYPAERPPLLRQFSVSSRVSGVSAYGHSDSESLYDSPMSGFPDNLDERNPTYRSPDPNASGWDTRSIDSSYASIRSGHDRAPQNRPIPAFGRNHTRRGSFNGSIAASTFYDGSIFEGINPNRAASIMSFPVGYGNHDHTPAPPSPSLARDTDSIMASTPRSVRQPSPPQSKSKGWGFGSVFSGDKAPSPLPALHNNPLKRTPSNTSSIVNYEQEGPRVPIDPKKAKKEAEKLAKEAEKRKRDAMQLAARERARAVMKKKNLLMEAADPLHNFSSNHPRVMAIEKGKARASERPPNSTGAPKPNGERKMGKIPEDATRLHAVDLRHKMRRRDEDDDVHSVSSNDTGASSFRGRPYSVSSQATSRSDPEQFRMRSQHDADHPPTLSSIHSSSSAARPSYNHTHQRAPDTGHSSLDHSFINNMQGLLRSESRGVRSGSPREPPEMRYSPYPHGSRPPGGHLNTFAEYSAAQFGLRNSSNAVMSSSASIASYRSVPSSLNGSKYQAREDAPLMSYLPVMDGGATPTPTTNFPYPASNTNGNSQQQQ